MESGSRCLSFCSSGQCGLHGPAKVLKGGAESLIAFGFRGLCRSVWQWIAVHKSRSWLNKIPGILEGRIHLSVFHIRFLINPSLNIS